MCYMQLLNQGLGDYNDTAQICHCAEKATADQEPMARMCYNAVIFTKSPWLEFINFPFIPVRL